MKDGVQTRNVCLVGDIHGYPDAFLEALLICGADPDRGFIPDDLTIIQVGDLVHSGPDSDTAVEIADYMLHKNPERYIQLWGNHDCHYVGGPDVSSRSVYSQISNQSQQTLRRWYAEDRLRLAVSLDTAALGPVLVTHAGLTAGLWRELGSPTDPDAAAGEINLIVGDPDWAFRPGWLMTGTVDFSAGVTGARTGAELAASWLEMPEMPFSQIHGHEGVWWWPSGSFHDDVSQEVKNLSTVDAVWRQSWVTIKKKRLWSIDAKLDQNWYGWRPLLMTLR